jgi:hypothetical protein
MAMLAAVAKRYPLGARDIVERVIFREAGEYVLGEILRIQRRDSAPLEIAQQDRVKSAREFFDGNTVFRIPRRS